MKRPFHWDPYSDQPDIIRDKRIKLQIRQDHWLDYLKLLATSILIFPLGLLRMMTLADRAGENTKEASPPDDASSARKIPREMLGMGVSLDKGDVQLDLLDELDVDHVLLRIPLWDTQRLADYVEFAKELKDRGKHILGNILQDPDHIQDPALLLQHIRQIFQGFDGLISEYQIGNAINRLKWGFASIDEYLKFFQTVQDLRDQSFPSLQLIGPSIIDFEYHYLVRALFNNVPIRFDKISALLYVDRKGSPRNRQLAFFDSYYKMRLLKSFAMLSRKARSSDIYITEVNWPLKGTAPYAPTSENECVSIDDYCQYMLDYHRIAYASGVIDRVYWHQLIAPGYGLVDNRNDTTVRTKAFFAYREMVALASAHHPPQSSL